MDFGALPPEVNSGRMYVGPGPASLLAAAAAWESLAAELNVTAGGYESVITTLTTEWQGPTSISMAAAAAPYVGWIRAIARLCEQSGTQAAAAAAAYETAYAMTVPPPLVAANRSRLIALIATNFLGQNTPAIMATEAEYSEMWAQDATAMYGYAASSASASTFSTFSPPPKVTNPGGMAGQAGAVAQTAGTQAGGNVQSTSAHLISSVPQALQGLSTPGSSGHLGLSQTAMGTGESMASAAYSPVSALTSLGNSPSKSAANAVKSATAGTSAASGMAGLTNFLQSPTGVAFGVGSGVGADAGGVAADVGGLGMDFFGVGLDLTGVETLSEGAGGLGALGGLGGLAGGSGLPSLAGINGVAASASVGQAASLGTLSVPPGWAETVSSVTPLPALDANAAPGGWGATPTCAPGAGVSKLPLGGMVGREAEGAVQRIGFRPSLIPRSPVAG